MEQAAAANRRSLVTSETSSPSIQIWRSSQRESKYWWPERAPISCAPVRALENNEAIAGEHRSIIVAVHASHSSAERCTHCQPHDDFDRLGAAALHVILMCQHRQRLRIGFELVQKLVVPLRIEEAETRAMELMRTSGCHDEHAQVGGVCL